MENLRTRCIGDPGNAKEILIDGLNHLRRKFGELSAADAEPAKQNVDLIASQESLEQTNKRLAMAQPAAGAGIWDWDTTTNHIEWSMQLFDLFGLDPQSTMASFEAWNAIIHPDDREIANFRIEKALKERTTLKNEYRIMLPNGQMRWINAVSEGVYNDQCHAVRTISICIDIIERKRKVIETGKEVREQLWLTRNGKPMFLDVYPECGFAVCAKADEEVIELVRMHQEIAHGTKESLADVGKKIKEHITVAPIKPTGDPRVAKKKSLLDTYV